MSKTQLGQVSEGWIFYSQARPIQWGQRRIRVPFFLSHHLTSGLGDAKTARSATAKSWQNRGQNYKNKKIKKKKVGSPYPSLIPALTNDQNKGDEKAPQGQRRNEANNLKKIETLITGEIFTPTIK